MKKIISLVLCVAMLLQIAAVAAYADDTAINSPPEPVVVGEEASLPEEEPEISEPEPISPADEESGEEESAESEVTEPSVPEDSEVESTPEEPVSAETPEEAALAPEESKNPEDTIDTVDNQPIMDTWDELVRSEPAPEVEGLSGFLSAMLQPENVDGIIERNSKGRSAVSDENKNELLLQLNDDTILQYLYFEDIKYKDQDGQVVYKDTNILVQEDPDILAEGYEYTNGANDYRVNISANPEKGIALTDENGSTVRLAPKMEAVTAENNGEPKKVQGEFGEIDVIEYKNIFGDKSVLRVSPQLNGCKKEIILDEYSGMHSFSFILDTGTHSAVINEENMLCIVDDEGTVQSIFAAPFAYDSFGGYLSEDEHYTDQCVYTLSEKEDTHYILTIEVPEDFLTNENIIYPVTIDPVSVKVSNGTDTVIHSGKGAMTSGSDEGMGFGKTSDFGNSRALVKFTVPTAIKKGAKIVSANYFARELTARTVTTYVRPYIVTSAWDNNTSWSNRPTYDTASGMTRKNINSNSKDIADAPYWYKFNITPAVQKWVDGTIANNGIIFVSEEESLTSYCFRSFSTKEYPTSGMRPYIEISYSNRPAAPATVTVSPTAWTKGSIKVTHAAVSDTNGISKYQYGLSTSKTTAPTSYADLPSPTALTHTLATPTKGARYVWVRAVNKDGVAGAGKASDAPYNYDPDSPAAPSTVTVSPTAWTNGSITVTHAAVTDASGIAKYQYGTSKTNTTAPTTFADLPSPTALSHALTNAAEGSLYVWVRAVDKAGNAAGKAKCAATVYKRDKTKPTTPTSLKLIADPAKQGNKKLVWTGVKDALSGVKTLQYKQPGGSYVTIPAASGIEKGEFSFACGEAVTDITFKIIDNAANFLEVSTELKIDAPSGFAAKPQVNHAIRLTWNEGPVSGMVYDVYRASASGTAAPADTAYAIVESGITETYWYDYNLSDGALQYYKIKARVNYSGEEFVSAFTAAKSAQSINAAAIEVKKGQQNQPLVYDFIGASGGIHPLSGNLSYQTEDVNTNSAVSPIGFTRIYNSLEGGWNHSLNISLLTVSANGQETGVLLQNGAGERYLFTKNSSGGYTRPAGFFATLNKSKDGLFSIDFNDGNHYYFNRSNQIQKMTDIFNREILFAYQENGNLESVSNSVGDVLELTYDVKNIDQISTAKAAGITAYYTYNADGTLKKAYKMKDEEEISEEYTYANGLLNSIQNANGDVHAIVYGADKKLKQITNPKNEAFTVAYTDGGKTVTAASLGSTIVQKYDDAMQMITAALNGRTTSYAYDSDFNIIKATNPDGSSETSSYDQNGNLLTSTDTAGNTTSYSYDSGKTVPKEVSAPFNGSDKIVTRNTYDGHDQLASSYIVGTNRKTFYQYDAKGNNIKTAAVTGAGAESLTNPPASGGSYFVEETTYTYDEKNRLKTTTRQGGEYGTRTTSNVYDDETNDVLKETDPTTDTSYTYDELGQVTGTVTEDGQISDTAETVYDSLGNAIEETTAAGTATTEYDQLGRVIRTVDESGLIEETTYGQNADGSSYTVITKKSGDTLLSKELSVTDQWGNNILEGTCALAGETGALSYQGMSLMTYTQNTYNVNNRLTETTDHTGLKTGFVYDAMGRTLSDTQSKDGKTEKTSYTYDAAGNKLTETAADGTATAYCYDKLGRTLSITTSKDGKSLVIDAAVFDTVEGGLLKVQHKDAMGRSTTKYSNILGDTMKEVCGTKTTAYTYDGSTGNLLTSTLTDTAFAGKSAVTSYEYSGSQEVKRSYGANHAVATSYDPATGNVLSETVTKNGVADIVSYTYDDTGKDIIRTQRGGEAQSFGYSPDGQRESVTYGSGNKVQYNYDSEGKIKTVSHGGKTVESYQYNNRAVLTATLSYTAAGEEYISQRFTYDWLGRIIKTEYLSKSGSVEESYELTYNASGNIATEKLTENYTSTPKVTEKQYEYDWLKRLTKETVNGAVTTYTYDAVGNRLTMTGGGVTLNYTYNNADQLTEIKQGSEVVTSFAYDVSGNQITKTENGVTTSYTFDQANQLEKVQEGQTVLGTYTYDAKGQRLTKTAGSSTTKYFYNDLDLLYTKENNKLAEVNVFTDTGDIILGIRGAEQYSYHKDTRGSVTNILDSAGKPVLSYSYDAYGNTTGSNQSFKNSFAYTGAVIDPETKLYYMNARYYDTATGRFISQDSFRGGGESFWHVYGYCDGDPINSIDPTGYKPKYLSNKKLKDATYIEFPIRVKATYSSKTCLNRIYKNETYIKKYSKEFKILPNMVRAILYRELMCTGYDDEYADALVIDFYRRGVGKKNDSSTGMAQIFAKTAILAEAKVKKKLSVVSLWDMWVKLQKDKESVYYCAMVLRMEANNINKKTYKTFKTKDYSKIAKVFAKYNGSGKKATNYGKKTLSIYKEFVKSP